MAKIDIPGLVIKTRGARVYHYWQPSAALRKAGWTALTLGSDLRTAMKLAEAQNDKVEEWRSGGAKPRQVRKFIAGGTVDQLIARFKALRYPTIKPSTEKTYNWALGAISKWAGPEKVAHIDRNRVRKLRDVLLKPDSLTGIVSLNRANGIMRVLSTLMKFAIDEGFLQQDARNPASDHNVPSADPRHQVWSPAAVDLIVAAALEAGQPGLALAILLARECAQREGDLIKFPISKWAAIPRHKLEADDWERMAEPGPDGTRDVRGVRLRQGKTNRWIEVPIVGDTRRLIEDAIAEARQDGTTVLLQERRQDAQGEAVRVPWTGTRLQRAIAALRPLAAASARENGDEDLAAEIEDLQFRDLRRTAVVWLGELGIEDHLIAAITGHNLDQTKQILETYMPRNTKMAGKAIALRLERDRTTPATKEKQA
jgi:hypothetical protein